MAAPHLPARREVLYATALSGTAAFMPPAWGAPDTRGKAQEAAPPLPTRDLGKTGVKVSVLGLGGHALGQARIEEEAIQIVHEALDAGLTFMDNAWEYHDGRSEEWMGKALRGKRERAFVMTKVCTHGRDARVAMQQLEESLRRLQTDYLDLWQIHECVYENDPDLHFEPGGVIEALDKARQQGKVRYTGFTGHKDPSIHLKMLARDYAFDAVQMPLNPFDGTYRSFEKEVLPELQKRGIGIIGMKSLGGTGEAIKQKILTIDEALGYVLSLPISTLVSGINSPAVLRLNLQIARQARQMGPAEMDQLREKCRQYAADGRFELYKSSKKFDGAPGRAQHGFPPPEKAQD